MDEKPIAPPPSTLNKFWGNCEEGVFQSSDYATYAVTGVKTNEEGEVIKSGTIRRTKKKAYLRLSSKQRRQIRKLLKNGGSP